MLVGFCLQALLAVPKLSATADEPVHLAAGYSYWKIRDFRINPEHPPLAKLIAAFPLLMLHPNLDVNHADWTAASEYDFGVRFLYSNDADRLLFWGRAALVMIAAIGLIVAFLWARDLFGIPAGMFAAAMYAFSPNLLGHGMLITTDVPLAVFTTLAFYLFWKSGERPSWRVDVATGLALGAAMACKFSGAFLPVLLGVLCVIRDRRSAVQRLAIIGCAALIVIEAAYLFSVSPLLYFQNASLVNSNHVRNYPFFLLGQLKAGGWWYYFPLAFLVKATVPTLLIIAFATVHLLSSHFISRWGEVTLLAAIVFYGALICVAADQIGLRYWLPILPLIFIWASRIAPGILAMRKGVIVLAILLAWQALSAFRSFPNYIPYFNELAGGPAAGPTLLDDSNIDWGQGVKQAAQYVKDRHLRDVHLYTFSPYDNPQYYGLPPNIRPSEAFQRLVVEGPSPGIYVISSHYVARMRAVSPAWKMYKPVDRIGESLWVYSF
jgi:hypothetical protein